jgi:hypothetical protein
MFFFMSPMESHILGRNVISPLLLAGIQFHEFNVLDFTRRIQNKIPTVMADKNLSDSRVNINRSSI